MLRHRETSERQGLLPMDRFTTGILDAVCGRFGTGRDEVANSPALKPETPSRVVLAVIG